MHPLPSFGARSRAQLATCDQRLIDLFQEVVKGYDCTILQGARSAAEQAENVRKGVSQTLDSKHVTSESHPVARAVDVAPFPIDWHDTPRFYHFAGYVKKCAEALGVSVRWGGAWSGALNKPGDFMDLVHWELVA